MVWFEIVRNRETEVSDAGFVFVLDADCCGGFAGEAAEEFSDGGVDGGVDGGEGGWGCAGAGPYCADGYLVVILEKPARVWGVGGANSCCV